MARPTQWISAARPRTLPAAVAPVLVGSAAGYTLGPFSWWRAVLALIVSLALQIGVNYANDYSDGIRGTDADRVGPFRMVGSGAAPARQVKSAAFIAFGVAGVAGLGLATLTTWWLVPVGAVCVLAAWFYTGGSRPYGYAGYGEIFVFVFFGLVAVLGSTYVQAQRISYTAVAGAIGVGLLACALLVANNLRDVHSDPAAGKRTLAVILGEPLTRKVYVLMVAGALLSVVVIGLRHPWCLIGLLAIPAAVTPTRTVLSGARGRALIPVLGGTGRVQVAYALLLAVGLVIGR